MNDKVEVPTIEIEAVKRPLTSKIAEAGSDIFKYIEWLEERQILLQDELKASPGAEARGICWIDLFGYAKGDGEARYKVKANLTQRSDVSAEHAFRSAFNALKTIKGEFHMHPYIQDLTYAPGKGNGQQPKRPRKTWNNSQKVNPRDAQPMKHNRQSAVVESGNGHQPRSLNLRPLPKNQSVLRNGTRSKIWKWIFPKTKPRNICGFASL